MRAGRFFVVVVSVPHIRFQPDVHMDLKKKIKKKTTKNPFYSKMSISFNSKCNIITVFHKHLTRRRHFLQENITRVSLLAV